MAEKKEKKQYLDFSKAREIIKEFKVQHPLKEGERYKWLDLLDLDALICGYLTESKAGNGLFYSDHTMRLVLEELDADVVYATEIVGYTVRSSANENLIIRDMPGYAIRVSFESKTLPLCLNPVELEVMDTKMNIIVNPNSHQISNTTKRAKVRAVALTTGLGYLTWLKAIFVTEQMKACGNYGTEDAIAEANQWRQRRAGNYQAPASVAVSPRGIASTVKQVSPRVIQQLPPQPGAGYQQPAATAAPVEVQQPLPLPPLAPTLGAQQPVEATPPVTLPTITPAVKRRSVTPKSVPVQPSINLQLPVPQVDTVTTRKVEPVLQIQPAPIPTPVVGQVAPLPGPQIAPTLQTMTPNANLRSDFMNRLLSKSDPALMDRTISYFRDVKQQPLDMSKLTEQEIMSLMGGN